MFPGQHHTRSGMPSRVTAMPMTIWGRSSRWSLDLPQVRNPVCVALPAAVRRRPGSWLPVLVAGERGVGFSVTKYVLVVSKNSRSTSRPSTWRGPVEDLLLQLLADLQQPAIAR